METNQTHRERRRGPDFWLRSIKGLVIICWCLLLAIMIIMDFAKPTYETFFDRLAHVPVTSSWNTELLQVLFYLMVLGLELSLLGLLLNTRRNKRKTDHYPGSLFFIAGVSLAGIIYYLFR